MQQKAVQTIFNKIAARSPSFYKLITHMELSGRTKEAVLIILGRAFIALGGLITVRIVTELMTPEQMGTVTQMFSLATLSSIVIAVPVWHYMARGFQEWHETGKLYKYIKQFLVYILFTTFLVLILTWFIQSQFHPVANIGTEWVVMLVVLYFVSKAITTIGTNGFNILNRRIYFVISANIPVWIGMGLAVLMFKVMNTIPYWILGLSLGYTLASFSVVVLLRMVKKVCVNKSGDYAVLPFDVKAVFNFAWPVVLVATLWWLQSQSYRFIIPGMANVGLFAMGYGLAAAPMALYEGLFGQFYEPIYYEDLKFQDSGGQAIAWNHYAAAYLPGVICIGIFIASSGHFLASLLLGEEFREAAETIVVWAAVIETMRGIGAMMYHLGVAKVDSRVNLLPATVGSILSVSGIYFFSHIVDPLLGTCMGLFGAGLVVLIIVLQSSKSKLPVTWPYYRMVKAAILSIPLIICFWAIKLLLEDESIWSTVGILSLGGAYMLVIQFILFRSVVFTEKEANHA